MVKALSWFTGEDDKDDWRNSWRNIPAPTFKSKTPSPAPAPAPVKPIRPSFLDDATLRAPKPAPIPKIQAPKIEAPKVNLTNLDPFNSAKQFQPAIKQPVYKPVEVKPAQPKPIDYNNPLVFAGEMGKEMVKNTGKFMDYLNPLGKKGMFGRESVAENTRNIQKVGEAYSSGVDKILQEKGDGKLNSWKDPIRFVANLPAGMAQAMLESPKDIREALTGERLNLGPDDQFNGDTTQLDGWQRVGAGINAAINTGGLGLGGSLTLLKGIFGKVSKEAAETIAIKLIKDALIEGGEEAVQSLMTDLQNTGKFDDGSIERMVQSAALGAAGGGVMSGVGVGVNTLRGGNVDTNANIQTESNTPNQDIADIKEIVDTPPEPAQVAEDIQVPEKELSSEYLNIPKAKGSTEADYRAAIKKSIMNEAINFSQNEQAIKDSYKSNGNNKTFTETKALFKEFQKNPDAFIDKYGLLPPEYTKTKAESATTKPINQVEESARPQRGEQPTPAIIEPITDTKTNEKVDEIIQAPETGVVSEPTAPQVTKTEQLDIIKKLNPMTDDYHTGIRTVDDIKTYKEAFDDPESFAYPDFSKADGQKALDSGKIIIYSSKPLDKNNAQFVTPSKMSASDYAGNGKVYSKEVNVDDVAWINGDEGQLVGSQTKITDPLDSLKQEALKYKSAEEFSKALTSPDIHKGGMLPTSSLKLPKKLYRGVSSTGSGVGSAGEGLGLYTTTDKKTAQGYAKNGGSILDMNPNTDIPKNPLYFRNSDYVRSWLTSVVNKLGTTLPDFNKNIGIENLVHSLGYDGIAFDHGNGIAYVKYADADKNISDLYNQAHSAPQVTKTEGNIKFNKLPESMGYKNGGVMMFTDDAGNKLAHANIDRVGNRVEIGDMGTIGADTYRQGRGSQLVDTIKSQNPDKIIVAKDVLPDARGFWKKMGFEGEGKDMTYSPKSTPIVTKTAKVAPDAKPVKETLAPIKPKKAPTPVVDETGKPRPVKQPEAVTPELGRTKQKALADKKRGLAEIRRIVGPHALKDVYTITNPRGKTAGKYRPYDGRIGIKGVGTLDTYRHEAMHKAFAENLKPDQQAAIFQAILRENGTKKADFANMKDSEISALIGNADEKLNYALSKYIEDTNNIKDPELKQYFKDIMDGKYAGRQKQNAKIWSQSGVEMIKRYLQSSDGKASYKDIAPKLKTPSEKTARQVAGQISRNKKKNSDFTPNRDLATSTKGNKFMDWFVDRKTSLFEGMRRMDKDMGIEDGISKKLPSMIKESENVQSFVKDQIKNDKGSKISKFVQALAASDAKTNQTRLSEFDDYMKIKGTVIDHDAGLVFNEDLYARRGELKSFESKYKAERQAFNEVMAEIRENVSPFLTREAKDIMDNNPDYVPMRRDFTDVEKANAFLGKMKTSENVTARQGVVKGKQGGSERAVLSPSDTLLKMYVASKQAKINNDIIAGLADPRYGFKRVGRYTTIPSDMIKLTYFKDGVAKGIMVPKEFGNAFESRLPKVLTDSKLGKVAHALTVPVRVGATGANLGFSVANIVRDTGTNIIRTDQTARFITSIPKGIVTALTGKGELADIGKRNNITNNTRYSPEMKVNPVDLMSEVMQASGTKGKIIDAARHPIQKIKQAFNISENITRLAELDAQLRAGRAKGLEGKALESYAVEQARKHLPDYSESGRATAVINEYHPYMTAGVAGVRPLFRAFKERPAQTSAKMGAMMAAATALAVAQMAGNTGDAYDDVSDDEKDKNILFVMSDRVGEDGKADTIKMPLSPDLYIFNAASNVLAKAITGKIDGTEVPRLIENAVGSSTPITLALGEGENPLESVAQSLAPTMFNAFWNLSTAKNYKGKVQYDKYASDLSKGFSEAMNGAFSPAQIEQFNKTLLGNFTTPEKMLDVKSRFVGSYTKPGTAVNTKIDGKEVKLYTPSGSKISRIKASEGDWYEVTAGNEKAKDNGKIIRLDGQPAVYKGSVEGLNKKDISMLAMTADEVTRDQKKNKYDGQINYLSALKNAEDRDIATKDEKHDYFGRSMTTTQALAVAKVNKEGKYDYEFQQLYKDVSLTEWKELAETNPELYEQLYEYDSLRAGVNGSLRDSDPSKNKYYWKGGSGGSGSSSAKASAKAILDAIKGKPVPGLPSAPKVTKATYKPVNLGSSGGQSAKSKYGPIKVSAKSVKYSKDRSLNNVL